jgi:hypothetical protein
MIRLSPRLTEQRPGGLKGVIVEVSGRTEFQEKRTDVTKALGWECGISTSRLARGQV